MTNPITSPFGLEERLKPYDKDFNFFAALNILLIALGFILLGSRFIVAPGVTINIPELSTPAVPGIVVVDVMTLTPNNMILLEGRIYSMDNISKALEIRKINKVDGEAILLMKLDKETHMEMFLKICEIAQRAGYSQIQIAALPSLNAECEMQTLDL